jgi:hypothetical protein
MEENEKKQQTEWLAQVTARTLHTNHREMFSHELGAWLADGFHLWIIAI